MSQSTTLRFPIETSKPTRETIILIASALQGGVLGYAVMNWLIKNQTQLLSLQYPTLTLLSLLPIVYMVILAHELGHVLGGLLAGHRCQMLVVGPFKVIRGARKFEWRFNLKMLLGGGLALCLPTKLDRFRNRRLWLIAGGPLASMLFAILCWFNAGHASKVSLFLSDLLVITALISALIALVTLLPHTGGVVPSDGYQLLGLLRGQARAEKIGLVSLLYNLSMTGTRPQHLPLDVITRAIELQGDQPSSDAAAQFFAYSYHLDRGELDRAELHLQAALSNFDRLPKKVRQGCALEAAYFAAVHRHDRQLALAWYKRGKGGAVEPMTRLRVDAAMHILDGNLADATETLELARGYLKSSMDLGGSQAEADMLDQLEKMMEV